MQWKSWRLQTRQWGLLLLGGVLLALAGCGDPVEVEEEETSSTAIIGVTGAYLNADGIWRGPCLLDGSDGRVFSLILQGETGIAHNDIWAGNPACTGLPTGGNDDPFTFSSLGTKTNTWQGGSPPPANPALPGSLTVSLVLVLLTTEVMPLTMIIDDTVAPPALYMGAEIGPVDAQGFPEELDPAAHLKQ